MKKSILLTLGLILTAGALDAGDWPQFRGPGGDGFSADKGFPDRWSDKENLRGRALLPGRGQSSPIVAGGHVYVTASSGATQDRLHVLCFDAGTGKRLWAQEFWATGATISHPKTSMAAPTPVIAGGRLYTLFASGDLFCLDRDGLLLWCRTLARDYLGVTNHIGMASSPVVVGDVLVVVLETPEESFAAGIDARTGAEPLESGAAAGRHLDDAACLERAGRAEVVLQSGGKLSGHDGGTGRELWAYTGKELAKIASPVAGPGVVLAATRDELLAVRPARKRLAPRPWRGSPRRSGRARRRRSSMRAAFTASIPPAC